MNLARNQGHGQLVEPATLRIERTLPGPIERVWAYLTEDRLRRQWLAAGDMPLKQGAPFTFVWRNDTLSNPPSKRPADFPEEMRLESRILEVDAPHRLAISWDDDDEVLFELESRGDQVLLTITHSRIPNRASLLSVSAGWHTHLDILVSIANGGEAAPFWERWTALKADYDQRLVSE